MAALAHPPSTPTTSPWIPGAQARTNTHDLRLPALPPTPLSGRHGSQPLAGSGRRRCAPSSPSGGDARGDHTGWSRDGTCVMLAPHPHTQMAWAGRRDRPRATHAQPAVVRRARKGKVTRSLHTRTQTQLASASRGSLGFILSFFAKDLSVKKKFCFSNKLQMFNV